MTLMKHHFSHPMCNWTYTWILYVGKTSPIFNPLTHFLTCHDFKMTSSLGLRTIWLPRESMRFKGCLGIWWWICDLCYHPKFQVTHLEVLYPVPYIYIHMFILYIFLGVGGWVFPCISLTAYICEYLHLKCSVMLWNCWNMELHTYVILCVCIIIMMMVIIMYIHIKLAIDLMIRFS